MSAVKKSDLFGNDDSIDELVSEVALALNVAKSHAKHGSIYPNEVRAYAKRRVRYTESRPVRLAMADALIDFWMGTQQ